MKKSIYKSKKIKSVDVKRLNEMVKGKHVVFGIDVAKEDMFAVFMSNTKEALLTVKWKQSIENQFVLELLQSLECSCLEAAMEPSGNYGDSFRFQLQQAGIPVWRVGSKKSHDFCEIYDGVPSSHDAKSSAIVAHLHLSGMSDLWEERSDDEKQLRALIRSMEIHSDSYYRNLNRLEAILARHWPELPTILNIQSASLLELLIHFGSPQEVAAAPEKAHLLLSNVGGHLLSQGKRDAVICSASATHGMPPIPEECQLIKDIAYETRRSHKQSLQAKQKIEQLVKDHETIGEMGKVVGKLTAAVVFSIVGDPRHYSSAAAFTKSMGLNLKERSSGKHKGQLKITKRGASAPRRYLYMAVLRMIQNDVNFKRWYDRKVERDGGKKGRALVGLMRKLAKSLWHVGHGNAFQSHLLFDVNRLRLAKSAAIFD